MSSKEVQRIDWILRRIDRIITEAEEKNSCNLIEMRALQADASQLQRMLQGKPRLRASRRRSSRLAQKPELSAAQAATLKKLKKAPSEWHELDGRSGRALVRRGLAREDEARPGYFRAS